MNKYLQMLKSGKRHPDDGSKGSKDASEPFEPASTGRFAENVHGSVDLSPEQYQTSEPFEPGRGERAAQFKVGQSSGSRTLGFVTEIQMRSRIGGSKGSKDACEPFEPRPDEYLPKMSEFAGIPVEDGPYLPWGPYLTSGALKQRQSDLLAVVEELAKLERWPGEAYDIVVQTIEQQPISTLRPDLAYFAERLRSVNAAAAAREVSGRLRRGYDR
jgi:hypothetical protein